jgi:hypothetical protein
MSANDCMKMTGSQLQVSLLMQEDDMDACHSSRSYFVPTNIAMKTLQKRKRYRRTAFTPTVTCLFGEENF